MIRFGSVCSGIEAASVAWHPLGWEAAWFSEIEPFPSAVLAHHYPTVPNLGDMTRLPDAVRRGDVEAPDLLCGGTPCQAFSVAGLRRSLDDARGNLTMTFVELTNAIDAVRSERGERPAIIFWENVPGVLTTKDNAFGCFLGALVGEDCPLEPPRGRWSDAGVVSGPSRTVAWRILDAQYFGLAQRRRRVFLVASARAGFDPVAVLFEREGVRRDSAPSRTSGKGATGGASDGAGDNGQPYEVANCLTARMHKGINTTLDEGQTPVVCATGDRTHALTAVGAYAGEDGTGRGTPIVPVVHAFDARQSDVLQYGDQTGPLDTDGQSIGVLVKDTRTGLAPHGNMRGSTVTSPANRSQPKPGDPCHPLAAGAHAPAVAFEPGKMERLGYGYTDDGSTPTLRAQPGDNQLAVASAVAVPFQVGPQKGDFTVEAPTLDCRAKNGRMQNQIGMGVMQAPSMQVRRLTPRECERLQGFPDDYTQIPWRGKSAEDCPDGPRYRALGNSWAVPVVRWIGQRIAAVLEAAP